MPAKSILELGIVLHRHRYREDVKHHARTVHLALNVLKER